ncbi:hypothetical protein QN277_009793 [Acacia crassicarpa]|uniref:ATP-dependent rRNA helicase SPB4-like C-terminal extension domain-containing protein n=1 Tax=Acacia crassicarpa TaxID=499986 RepID=A0AAE1M5T8_9FABA|nr:hypothetical protein QN277_009793 [Acacia crassicarpa]
MPSEVKMLEKLEAAKVPVHLNKPKKERLQPVSGLLATLLVKYPDLQQWAKRAFITYLRSIHIQKDKEIFDIMKLPIDEYSASLGLPMTPKTRFLSQKDKSKAKSTKPILDEPEESHREIALEVPREKLDVNGPEEEEEQKGLLLLDGSSDEGEGRASEFVDVIPPTRVSKKKKLKINIHRPMGTRVVFDDEGNALPPLARIADTQTGKETLVLDPEQKAEYYMNMREEMKKVDKEDKLVQQQRRREKRIKRKMKLKEISAEEEHDDIISGSEGDDEHEIANRRHKKSKIYFDSDNDDDTKRTEVTGGKEGIISQPVTLEEQEALALKLLNSMHS